MKNSDVSWVENVCYLNNKHSTQGVDRMKKQNKITKEEATEKVITRAKELEQEALDYFNKPETAKAIEVKAKRRAQELSENTRKKYAAFLTYNDLWYEDEFLMEAGLTPIGKVARIIVYELLQEEFSNFVSCLSREFEDSMYPKRAIKKAIKERLESMQSTCFDICEAYRETYVERLEASVSEEIEDELIGSILMLRGETEDLPLFD